MKNEKLQLKSKKFFGFKLLILIFTFSFFIFNLALAQWTPGQPIVPCTSNCTSCQLLQLIRNVIDFLMIGAAPVLAIAFFVWAGVYMILGGANPGMLAEGKNMFKNTFIGLLIVMLSWLITNTVIQTIAKPNVTGSGGNWWTITCQDLGL